MSVDAMQANSPATQATTEITTTALRQTAQQQDVSQLEMLVDEEQLDVLRQDADRDLRAMATGPSGA